MRFSVLRAALLASVLFALPTVVQPVAAHAEPFGAPGWELTSRGRPTNLAPNGTGTIQIEVFNIGAADSEGAITVTDTLPSGITGREEEAEGKHRGGAGELIRVGRGGLEPEIGHELWVCTGNGPGAAPHIEGATVVSCTNDLARFPSIAGGGGHPSIKIAPTRNLQPVIGIAVHAPTVQGTHANRVTISGGGASASAASEAPVTVSASPPSFGFTKWDGWFSNADGTLDTQAGSHPYEWTTVLDLADLFKEGEVQVAGGEARDILVTLPPGVIGNPTAVAQCTRQQLDNDQGCPDASQVGIVTARFANFASLGFQVFNMVPPAGGPAEFAFVLNGINTYIDPTLRSGGDYGVTAHINDTPAREVIGAILTLWGVPGDPSHDRWRTGNQGGCSTNEVVTGEPQSAHCFSIGQRPSVRPFLTLPTSCTGPQPFSIAANTWRDASLTFTEPLSFLSHDAGDVAIGFTGCGALPFTPVVAAIPESSMADTPTGLHVDVHVPQPETSSPAENLSSDIVGVKTGLAEAQLKDAVVTLPAGVSVNPASANGLAGCSSAQIELRGPDPAQCPDASKIGTVEVDTPLADHPIKGSVYVAAPHDNPFGGLLAIYVVLVDARTGTVVKVAGHVEADPVTGQLTTRFQEAPQLPVEDFKLDFFGGPGAALRTPSTCAVYTTIAKLTPWTSPEGEDRLLASTFEVSSGANGSACANSETQEPNTPSFEAGTTTPLAGSYSPFVLKLSREDGSQNLKGVSATLPPGLTGKLAGVAQCPQASIESAEHRTGGEEQQSPSCPGTSELGIVDIAAGAGPHPYHVTGRVYLAGPYRGAPFSLAVVTPAVAGPYDLGTVVVRTALYIDPHTVQVHAVSDPLPTILQGIPLDIRSVALNLSRPDFMLNPTNCSPLSVGGEALSILGQSVSLNERFQVGGCAGLRFAPSFTVSTQAKTSKKNGASLDVKVTYPSGSQANLHSVAVTLPKQLPSRLTTIQQACTAAVFAANPASCPAGSNIGVATAHTPVLTNPVSGPTYLVSHGGAAFPDVVVILQGEGVTLDLTGSIDIKKGVTSSTFSSIPDAPISSFELILPEGPHSGLAAVLPAKAKGSLCGTSLVMPTTLTGQNGAVIKQNTKIAVTGCPKVKKKAKVKKHTKGKKK